MPSAVSRTIAGFIAGFLAVAIFHQGMYVLLQQFGLPLAGKPWNMGPNAAAFGMPAVLNQCFWGGLWGIGYAFLADRIPGEQDWLKGFIFGFVGPMLLGGWIVVALIKGAPMFSGAFAKGFDGMRLVPSFFLNAVGFGIGLGLIYPLLARALPGEARLRG